MEKEYGWPVMHKKGWPDCIGYEEDIYDYFQLFNAKSKAIKALFINQFGFDTRTCGDRVPVGTTLFDLRVASDVEFGYSIYEPFGISQIETIPYGGVSLLSRACGASFLFENIWEKNGKAPFHIIDFSNIEKINLADINEIFQSSDKITSFKNLNEEIRKNIENEIFKLKVDEIYSKIPKTDKERQVLLENKDEKVMYFSWESRLKEILSTL